MKRVTSASPPSVVAALFLVLAVGRADAFETATPEDAHWPGSAMTYNVNSASFAVDGLSASSVAASFEAWEADSVANVVLNQGPNTTRVPADDGFNDIYYENTFFPAGSSVLAVTLLAWIDEDIVEADLTVNGANFSWVDPPTGGCTTAYDLRSTVIHEAGHVLGLGHSSESLSTCDPPSPFFDPVFCDATMYFAGGPCDASGQSLECDDRAGIRFLYPPGGTARADWVPEGFGAAPSGGSVDPGQLVMISGTAANRGSVSTLSGTAALYLETSPGVTNVVNRVQTTSLSSRGSCRTQPVALSYTFTAADSGTRWLNVKLDDGGSTTEVLESDNVVSLGPFTVSGGPRVAVSTGDLDFVAVVGSPPPPGQSVTVTNQGSGTFTWSATDDQPWLFVGPGSGAPGASFTVTVDHAGLPAGPRSGTVTVTAPGALDSPRLVTVDLTVTAGPVLGVSPSSLAFAAQAGGALPPSKSLDLTNDGGGTLSWTASDDAPWLNVSPGSGVDDATLTVSVTTTSLAPGQHVASVTVAAGSAQGSPKVVAVTLDIGADVPTLTVAPLALTFSGPFGGTAPPSQELDVTNTGTGTLTFTVSDNRSWITVAPSGGTAPSTLDVSVDPAGLPAGTSTGSVVVTSVGAVGSPLTIPVSYTLQVVPSIDATPTSVAFAAVVGGGNPAPQFLRVANDGSGTLDYVIAEAASWLTVATPSGTLASGAFRQHRLDVSITGLGIGDYPATLVVTDPDADDSPRQVPVTLAITSVPPLVVSPLSLDFVATAAAPAPPAQSVLIGTSGTAAAWTASSADSWIQVEPSSGSSDGSVAISVNAVGLSPGLHAGNAIIAAPALAESPQQVSVRLMVQDGPRLSVSPPSGSWSVDRGAPLPPALTFTVTNSGQGSLAWTVSGAPTWLQVDPPSGSAPGSFTARPFTTDLSPGRRTANLSVEAPGAYDSPATLVLTYDIRGPSIVPSPSQLTFQRVDGATVGGTSRVVTVGAGGTGAFTWTARANRPWVTVLPTSGNSGDAVTVSLASTAAQLPVGMHDAAVVFESSGAMNSPAPVPVIVHVLDRAPSVFPDSLELHARVGDGLRDAAGLAVDEAGTSDGAWTLDDAPSWLSLVPSSGTSGADVRVFTDTTGLPAGTFDGELVLASGAERIVVPARLIVRAQPELVARPTSIALFAREGTSSRQEVVVVENVGTSPSTFSSRTSQPWLRVVPQGSTAPTTVTISADATGLAVGKHAGVVTLDGGGVDGEIAVDFGVVSISAPVADFQPSAAEGCAPLSVTFQNLSTGPATSHAWTFGDGQTSPQQSPLHVFSQPGVHEVTLVSRSPAGTSKRTIPVVVGQPPLVHAGLDRRVAFAAGGNLLLELTGARVVAAAPARIASLAWTTSRGTFADTGTATSSLERPTLVLASARGGFSVNLTLTATDDRGCQGADDASLVVSSDLDADRDSVADVADNCVNGSNALQDDADGDGVGDRCDDCPADHDPLQLDLDGVGGGDACGPEVASVALRGLHARPCDGVGLLRAAVHVPSRVTRAKLIVGGARRPITARALGAARGAGGTAVLAPDGNAARVDLRVPAGVITADDVLEMGIMVQAGDVAVDVPCVGARVGLAAAEVVADCSAARVSLTPNGDIAPKGQPDGDVNVGDIVRVLQASVDLETLTPDENARVDVAPGVANGATWVADADCEVNVGDVVILLKVAVEQLVLAP